ncbi:MAG: PAS domain S-box protein [Thermodesulfobacteriota bacterium]
MKAIKSKKEFPVYPDPSPAHYPDQPDFRLVRLEKENRDLINILETLRRKNEHLTALHETALSLIDRLDKEELLEAILLRAAKLSGTGNGFIYLLEPGETEMQMRVGMGFFKNQLGRRVTSGEGLGGTVWKTNEPILVEDYRYWKDRIEDTSLDALRSAVGIPLKDKKRFHGVLGLACVDPEKKFQPEDIIFLKRFADLALVALDKARLYTAVRRELAERKLTEQILRGSEERYRQLLESSPDPIVVYTMMGTAVYVNPAFEQTFGFGGEVVLGRQIDFVPEESKMETQKAIEHMLRGEKIELFETKRLTKDGRVLDVQISSTIYKNNEGKPEGNIVILRDISAQKRAEKELKQYREQLEDMVAERTAELAKINTQLKQEVEDRKRAEKTLRKREVELKAQSHHLEEVNTALKVLLKQREEDKKETGENILSNVKELIFPYLGQLQSSRLNTTQQTLTDILESNLNNIISPFLSRLSSKYFNFTSTEIKIANLVKEGKTNKEIAELLFLSKNTVMFHRYNIRSKLQLKNKKINLRSHLLSYDE